MMMITRLAIVALTALGVVYVFAHHLNLWSLIASMATIIFVVYRVEHVPETRIPLRRRAILITGCDTGFGNALTRHLDKIGIVIFAGCLFPDSDSSKKLKEETSANVHVFKLDVTSDQQVEDAKELVLNILIREKLGLWAVVNIAGVGAMGDIELATMKHFTTTTDVNYMGTVRVTKAFLHLVRQAKGRIINMGSSTGLVPFPLMSAYSVSKHAVETFSEILRLEMKRFNVKVITIEPGNFIGSTNIYTAERAEQQIKDIWENLNEEQKKFYGKEYIEQGLTCISKTERAKGVVDSKPVITALDEALFLINPKNNYIVSGSNWYFDELAVLAKISNYIPTTIRNILLSSILRKMPAPHGLEKNS